MAHRQSGKFAAVAQYVVVRDQGQWKISLNGTHYGPYATQRDAVVLPWTLHTRRAKWALTAKSCSGINSEPSGPTEKTPIRRIAQTSSDPLQTLRRRR